MDIWQTKQTDHARQEMPVWLEQNVQIQKPIQNIEDTILPWTSTTTLWSMKLEPNNIQRAATSGFSINSPHILEFFTI